MDCCKPNSSRKYWFEDAGPIGWRRVTGLRLPDASKGRGARWQSHHDSKRLESLILRHSVVSTIALRKHQISQG
jgi:hypothetical protein